MGKEFIGGHGIDLNFGRRFHVHCRPISSAPYHIRKITQPVKPSAKIIERNTASRMGLSGPKRAQRADRAAEPGEVIARAGRAVLARGRYYGQQGIAG